jgi:hypothetical protein
MYRIPTLSECPPPKLAYTCSTQGTVRCSTKQPVKNTQMEFNAGIFAIIFVIRPFIRLFSLLR